MRGGFILKIFSRMDIGPTTSQQKPVADIQQVGDSHMIGVRRDHQRHAIGDVGNGAAVHFAHTMHGVTVVDQMCVADDTNDGPGHSKSLFTLLKTYTLDYVMKRLLHRRLALHFCRGREMQQQNQNTAADLALWLTGQPWLFVPGGAHAGSVQCNPTAEPARPAQGHRPPEMPARQRPGPWANRRGRLRFVHQP